VDLVEGIQQYCLLVTLCYRWFYTYRYRNIDHNESNKHNKYSVVEFMNRFGRVEIIKFESVALVLKVKSKIIHIII